MSRQWGTHATTVHKNRLVAEGARAFDIPTRDKDSVIDKYYLPGAPFIDTSFNVLKD